MLVIEVQCCQNCQRHNWCSRHNQAKYHQFSSLLESRLQPFHPHLSYKKNQPPVHYTKKTLFSNLGFPIQSYYDELKKQIAIFPRHGAFQITVNGILIFSKLQSNVWPNIDKIALLISEIKEEIDNGGDIKKYSIDYRLNNVLEDKERVVAKEKKSVKFKISKRPKSHEFNGSVYGLKGGNDQTFQKSHQKKRTKEGNSKQKLKPQRRSEVGKKSLIKLKIKKNQSAHSINNQQSTHSINNNQQILKIDQQFPYFARRIEGHQSSLMLNKRIQQKNEILRQVKSQQLKSMANKGFIKLQKKSRKLLIQSNKTGIKKEQFTIYKSHDKVQQKDHNSQQILFFKTPLKHEQQTDKKQHIRYHQQTDNEPSFERNTIEVEDYQSQKQINSIQSLKYMKDLKDYNEVDQSSNKKIDIICMQEDSASDYLIQIEVVKEYWEEMVEEVIELIRRQFVQPIEIYKQVINEDQEQSFQGYSQNTLKSNKVQQTMQQQLNIPYEGKSENKIECQASSLQEIQQVIKDPITEFCHLEAQKQQIEQDQQLIQQSNQESSHILLNNPPNLMLDDNLIQKPLQNNGFLPSPLQQSKQIQPSDVSQPKQPQRKNFTLDEVASQDSKSIQQLLIKQQSKLFSLELANSILENNRLLYEDNIKQVIQTLEQQQQNKFILNEQINNSDDNIGIAFQLTKEQGFFEGKKQSPAKSSFFGLKRLEERNKEEELEYSVYSDDPKERFFEGRESKVISANGIEIEADKQEDERYSNQTIVEAQSNLVDPTIIVQPKTGQANQQIERRNTLPEQNNLQQNLSSSAQLADVFNEQHQKSLTPQAQQQIQQQQPQINNTQLQTESAKQPFNPVTPENRESPSQKPIKSSKSFIQKQNQQPSLRCLSSIDDHKVSQAERILPNTTETSISLSSQIRSQLNCIYYDIQARI